MKDASLEKLEGTPEEIALQLHNSAAIVHVPWCLGNWAQLKLGGVWVVPRSGLSFRKNEKGFDLSDVAKPVNNAFRRYQRQDFDCIASHYNLAGLKVTDNGGLLKGGAK